MDALLSSICHQYAVKTIVIIDDPARLPTTSHSKNSTQTELPIRNRLTSSIHDDLAKLIKWGGALSPSSNKSKHYIKQCRWSGSSSSVIITQDVNRHSAVPASVKKDVSPTRPTRR
jgi:hypothetical protein